MLFKMTAIGSGIASLAGTLSGIELLATCAACVIGFAWLQIAIIAPRVAK